MGKPRTMFCAAAHQAGNQSRKSEQKCWTVRLQASRCNSGPLTLNKFPSLAAAGKEKTNRKEVPVADPGANETETVLRNRCFLGTVPEKTRRP